MNSGNKKTVGILGGMGPEATVLLMSRVIAMTTASEDSDHVPLLVDNNTQVPSRIKALIEKTGEDPGPVLCRMAQRLEAAGATALAMPCNTAHVYASVIEKSVSIPLLNMLTLTAEYLKESTVHPRWRPIRRVGLLASPAVRLTGVFDTVLRDQSLEPHYPFNDQAILHAIKAIKSGRCDREVVESVQRGAQDLLKQGVDVLLIACSELSLLKEELPPHVPVVDSIDILARNVVEFSLHNRRFP